MISRIYTFLIIAAACIILFLTHLYMFLYTPTHPQSPIQIKITQGSSAWEIAKKLEEYTIITDAPMFMALAIGTGKRSYLQAGTYVFEGEHLPPDIINILFKGRTLRYRITIPEGSNLFNIGEIVSSTTLTSKIDFIEIAQSKDATVFFNINAPTMEGFLYPDTYFLAANMTPLEIMAKMKDRFNRIYTPDMQKRASKLGLSTEKVITLASIIEKEAVDPGEKPVISSVFHNRLKKKMHLQSDPTAIYGIDGFNRNIRHRDLLRDTPYNTYKYKGLPPGPICSPDKDSIAAALWPDKTPYLYFVSRGKGKHYFSKTLREHNRAIIRSNKRRR